MFSNMASGPHSRARALIRGATGVMAAGVFTLMAAPASSQNNNEPVEASEAAADSVLGEVLVTAQFREQSVQDTPIAITAVSADMLEARSQVSIVEVANQAPNVTLKPAAAPYGPSIQAFIRGVGQHDFNFALEPGVGMYVDDVYYSTLTGSVFDLLDLERVEVLRGPQGTLAGQNSIGGAIKLYSKKPTGDGGGYVQATYGQFNRTEVRAGTDFTLVPDKLFARVSGVARNIDGYVTRFDYGCSHPGSGVPAYVTTDNCKLGTEGGKAYDAIRTALRWVPNEKLEVNLIGDYTNDSSEGSALTLLYVGHVRRGACTGGPGICPFPASGATQRLQIGGVPFGTPTGSAFISYSPYGDWARDTFSNSPYINYSTYMDPDPVSGTPPFTVPAVSQVDGWGTSGTIDYTINDNLALKSITAYRYYSAIWSIDEDATPIGNGTLHNTVWHRQFSEELRLSGKLFETVNFTVGGLYFEQKSHYGARVDLAVSGLDFLENDDIPGETRAAFMHVDWGITDAMNLIGGVRYTEQEKTFVYGRLAVPGNTTWGGLAPPAVAPLNDIVGDFSGDELDYRVALQYKWTPSIMTYGQVATGFKGGGVNPRPFYPAQALAHQPETLTAYELGFKTDFFSRTLRLNGAVFLNKYEDILFSMSNCPLPGAPPLPCAMPVNAGRADMQGFELESELRPIDGLSIDASVSYLDFEYKELTPAAIASGVTMDMTAPFAPKWKYSLGAQYELPIGGAGTLTPRLDWSYQSSFQTRPNQSYFDRIAGNPLLNGRVTWRSDDETWNVSLEGTNLTNELYYLGIFENMGSVQSILGQPAQPRMWAVTVKHSF